VVAALTFSSPAFGPVVWERACRTSGFLEISSAVSVVGINTNSRRAMDLLVTGDEILETGRYIGHLERNSRDPDAKTLT
jgi:hypothetical protein